MFNRVQTFCRGPTAPPRNFCHPGEWEIKRYEQVKGKMLVNRLKMNHGDERLEKKTVRNRRRQLQRQGQWIKTETNILSRASRIKRIPGTEGVPGGAFLLGEVGMGGDLYLVHLDIVGIGGASCWSWNCLLSIELLLFSFHRTSLNFSSCPCLASSYSSLGMCSKNSGLCH